MIFTYCHFGLTIIPTMKNYTERQNPVKLYCYSNIGAVFFCKSSDRSE